MFYLDLFKALQKERVDYVLVGGLAVNFHGIERATMDVDLTLAMDQANLQRFLKVATRLKLKPILPVPLAALCDEKQIDEWIRTKHLRAFSLHSPAANLPTVDILVQPKVPFKKMRLDRINKNLNGVVVSFASLDDLIALKKGTGRKQDASDIKALQLVRRLAAKDMQHDED
jgi:predicted nucleotidyltransferase